MILDEYRARIRETVPPPQTEEAKRLDQALKAHAEILGLVDTRPYFIETFFEMDPEFWASVFRGYCAGRPELPVVLDADRLWLVEGREPLVEVVAEALLSCVCRDDEEALFAREEEARRAAAELLKRPNAILAIVVTGRSLEYQSVRNNEDRVRAVHHTLTSKNQRAVVIFAGDRFQRRFWEECWPRG